ncbi:hypothetical protein V8C34DRAFT_263137 [Trichoderma compactum]
MGEKDIFVGRTAVVFFFHVQEGRTRWESLGIFFVFFSFSSLSLMGDGVSWVLVGSCGGTCVCFCVYLTRIDYSPCPFFIVLI